MDKAEKERRKSVITGFNAERERVSRELEAREAEQRFFILKLLQGESHPPDKPFEIQLLDKHGRAKISGYVGSGDDHLVLYGYEVPKSVIDAVKLLRENDGRFVNERGVEIDMYGQPIDQ